MTYERVPVYRPFLRLPLPVTVRPCVPRNPQYRSLFLDSNATVGSCAPESRTRVLPAFSWLRIASWTSLFTVRKALLDSAFAEIGDPARKLTSVPFPLRKCVRRSADMGKPAKANPSATFIPSALSAANLAVSHPAAGGGACVSWLPLGGTG